MNDDFPKLEDLETWKRCTDLRNRIRKFTKTLPSEEKFRLTDQILRASRSITNNIAEGYGRFHYQENIQFLRQSRGSLYECIDHLHVSLDENYLTQEGFDSLYRDCLDCLKLINGYIKYLINRKTKELHSK